MAGIAPGDTRKGIVLSVRGGMVKGESGAIGEGTEDEKRSSQRRERR